MHLNFDLETINDNLSTNTLVLPIVLTNDCGGINIKFEGSPKSFEKWVQCSRNNTKQFRCLIINSNRITLTQLVVFNQCNLLTSTKSNLTRVWWKYAYILSCVKRIHKYTSTQIVLKCGQNNLPEPHGNSHVESNADHINFQPTPIFY